MIIELELLRDLVEVGIVVSPFRTQVVYFVPSLVLFIKEHLDFIHMISEHALEAL